MTGLFALLLFLFPLAYSPVPGNLYFAALGARSGTCTSVPASVGYHLATFVVTFGVGMGFLGLLTRWPGVFTAMTWAGSAYMAWLAWAFLRAKPLTGEAKAQQARVIDGALLLILNPMAYVIIALMFSQFLAPDDPAFFGRLLFMTTAFTLNNLIAFTVWTVLGEGLGRLFRTPNAAHALNAGFGLMLAGTAVWMVLR